MNTITTDLIQINTLTNLHVGSGDANYGIVDKLVQRDPSTRFPVINGSSLKGAIKEYSEEVPDINAKILKYIFGSTKKKDTDNEYKGINPALEDLSSKEKISQKDKNQNGAFKFFTAQILTIPVRSNIKPFFYATCPFIIEEFKKSIKSFGIQPPLLNKYTVGLQVLLEHKFDENIDFYYFGNENRNFHIEEYDNKKQTPLIEVVPNNTNAVGEIPEVNPDNPETFITNLFGDINSFVYLRDDLFIEICENLPVIARNKLEEPKNLWYEEVVPRGSKFYSFIIRPNDTDASKINSTFMEQIVVETGKTPLQIGANSSVGYGYCQITKIV